MIGGIWGWAVLATLIGFIPGFIAFWWFASPLPPGLWKLSPPFTRIILTVSQWMRSAAADAGVLVKRKSGRYEIGTYIDETKEVVLSDTRLDVDGKETRWGLFGRKPFGVTWEPGTDLHERIKRETDSDDALADGSGKYPINMAAAHRLFRDVNGLGSIERTHEQAEAEYGGGSDALDFKWKGVILLLSMVMGSMTTWLMLGV